jgi:ABC-type bacteriocin/lantibiotic exporter with double-glycine peptidase domain
LDEITSSLDFESEREVINNLQLFGIQFVLVSHKGNFEELNINNYRVLDL